MFQILIRHCTLPTSPAAHWLQVAKICQKLVHLMWFYEFFQLSFSKFTLFLFLVIACASYSKFIKSLQASVQKVNFMNLLNLISGGFLLFGPTCALPSISKAILNSTRNQLSTVGHFAPSI